jgi:hypothetical protein
MTPDITLSQSLNDPALFGNVFGSPSFWTWRTLAKLIDGLPLTERREIELFEACTGRSYSWFNRRAVRRLIILAGRRAGKDRFESAVAVWRAALCCDWRKHQSAGEGSVVILLGADRKQSAILRRYCHGLLQVPLLAREVTRSTGEVTEFRNGASLEISTNDPRLVRGRSAIAVLGSECCFWKTDEHNAASDEEVVPAAVNSMAMCPDQGLLMLASSVYRKAGYMFRQYKKLHGNDDASDYEGICWFAPSTVMNPKLPAGVIDTALANDRSKASADFLNVWREDIADFLPLDVIEACTDRDVHERAPAPGTNYFGYHDAAGGTGKDSFTLNISHLDGDRIVSDVIRERQPRFVAADVIKEYSTLLKSYGVTWVMGDGFGGGMYADEWTRNGITFRKSPYDTSDVYRHALPLFMAGRPLLLDHAKQRLQLSGLERRVTGGHEKIEHPQTASAHDDIAAAVCGCLVVASSRAQQEPPIVTPFIFSAGRRNLPGQYSPRIY